MCVRACVVVVVVGASASERLSGFKLRYSLI